MEKIILTMFLILLYSTANSEIFEFEKTRKTFVYNNDNKYEVKYFKYKKVNIDFKSISQFDQSTAEGTLALVLNSMITLNYELCLTLWTPSSVEFMNETYSERGITKDRILKTWKSFSEVEKNIFFVDKIEFSDKKNYAIIRYTSDESVAEYGATALSELDLVEVDGKWFATQELQKHPIAEYDW